jgi:hypothetical protein
VRVPTTTAPGPVATSRSGTRQQGPVGAESNRNWTNNLGPSRTYTASFNGGVAGASISFTQHGGHPRFYIQPGYTLTRKVPGRAWIGYSVGWSPGSPNERVKFGVGAALCRKYCLGGQTGYKGLGTYRGLSPFVGMGNGTSGWVSGGVRVPERGGLW